MYIFRGVSMVDSRVILAGAIPAAPLALIADFGLAAIEPRFSKLVSLVLLCVTFVSCSHPDRIVVGSKNFTEQVILGELVAQQIERKTRLEVERPSPGVLKIRLGDSSSWFSDAPRVNFCRISPE